jgi:hypothetical protein
VRPHTELLLENYSAHAQPDDHMALRLLKGSLRVITGWIGTVHRDGYAVNTPIATIGLRGTDHEPYVLTGKDADATPYEAGSYDKVNRGGTVITTPAGKVDVEPGRVGFAREVVAAQESTRGTLTLLLPELLDRIPDFYVAGRFERELDDWSRAADEHVRERLGHAWTGAASGQCVPQAAAHDWVERFDSAIAARNADAVLAMFDADARIEAQVRDGKGELVTQKFTQAQFARSARAATAGLSSYRQQRQTLDVESDPADACSPIRVRSHVAEQGELNGAPYRVESDEEFRLALRNGRWLAIESLTTQR